MATQYLLKKSSVAAKVPLTTDLSYGELALNYADGKLYFKNSSNVIKNFITIDEVIAQNYLTGNQNITVSGDASGSGATSIILTLANSGVTAGTYNDVATQVRPFTVDSKGRITSIGTGVTITPDWTSVQNKPTTVSGFGITDAVTTSGNQTIGGTKTFSSQVVSSLATGTAPFVVESTTRVANLNVATAGTADSATSAYRVYVTDTRSTAQTPQSFSAGIWGDFKFNTTDGLSDGGTYHGVLTLRQYASGSDWSGGGVRQLGFTDNHNLWIRGANADTTWSSWTRFLKTSDTDTANTASKVVIRDASGNFSAGTITAALSGNASTATVLQTARTLWGQSFNGSGNLTGSLDVTGIVKLGLQSSSINGTVLLEDRYNSTDGLVSLSTVRSSGGTMLGNGVMHAENATGFVSSTSISFAKSALVLESGVFKFKSVAAATVARGSAVTLTDRMTLDLSGNLSVTGNVSSAGTLYGTTAVHAAVAGNTTTATTQFVFATFSTGGFQALEILLSAKQGTITHITKLLVTHDTVTAIATEYGTLRTSTSLFNADVDISGGNVRVLITPTSATSTTFKASYNYLT